MECLFATHNPGKMVEIRALFESSGLGVRSAGDLGLRLEVEEDGETFAENAIKKALACAAMLKRERLFSIGETAVLADDSGLSIDALNGQPGVHSARFMGEATPYDEKLRCLLERLRDVPDEKRTARFICVIACVLPDGTVLQTEGEVDGLITRSAKGEHGFGYDPVFFVPSYGKTMAELSQPEKNEISHRGKAIRAMTEKLRSI